MDKNNCKVVQCSPILIWPVSLYQFKSLDIFLTKKKAKSKSNHGCSSFDLAVHKKAFNTTVSTFSMWAKHYTHGCALQVLGGVRYNSQKSQRRNRKGAA